MQPRQLASLLPFSHSHCHGRIPFVSPPPPHTRTRTRSRLHIPCSNARCPPQATSLVHARPSHRRSRRAPSKPAPRVCPRVRWCKGEISHPLLAPGGPPTPDRDAQQQPLSLPPPAPAPWRHLRPRILLWTPATTNPTTSPHHRLSHTDPLPTSLTHHRHSPTRLPRPNSPHDPRATSATTSPLAQWLAQTLTRPWLSQADASTNPLTTTAQTCATWASPAPAAPQTTRVCTHSPTPLSLSLSLSTCL